MMMTMKTNTMMLPMVWCVAVVLLLVVMVCPDYSQAFYVGRTGNDRAPMCSSPAKPCRLRASMGNFNGSELESYSAETCTCSPSSVTCPTDWDMPGHVVTRQVFSTTYNITLQMMFCRTVTPKRFCNRRSVALVVKGSLAMPQDIDSYNCRCRRRQPLVLHQRRIGDDHRTYHEYVCANHKPTCARTAPCMSMNDVQTNYHCKCPGSMQCRVFPSYGYEPADVTYGFCNP